MTPAFTALPATSAASAAGTTTAQSQPANGQGLDFVALFLNSLVTPDSTENDAPAQQDAPRAEVSTEEFDDSDPKADSRDNRKQDSNLLSSLFPPTVFVQPEPAKPELTLDAAPTGAESGISQLVAAAPQATATQTAPQAAPQAAAETVSIDFSKVSRAPQAKPQAVALPDDDPQPLPWSATRALPEDATKATGAQAGELAFSGVIRLDQQDQQPIQSRVDEPASAVTPEPASQPVPAEALAGQAPAATPVHANVPAAPLKPAAAAETPQPAATVQTEQPTAPATSDKPAAQGPSSKPTVAQVTEASAESKDARQQDSSSDSDSSDSNRRGNQSESTTTAYTAHSAGDGAATHSAAPAAKSAPATATAQTSAIDEPEAAAPKSPLQDLTISLNSTPGKRVDLVFAQNGDDVKVTVRAQDASVASSLNAELPRLEQSLQDKGYAAELWSGTTTHSTSNDGGTDARSSSDQRGQGFHNPYQTAGQGGSFNGGNSQADSSRQQARSWSAEMEDLMNESALRRLQQMGVAA